MTALCLGDRLGLYGWVKLETSGVHAALKRRRANLQEVRGEWPFELVDEARLGLSYLRDLTQLWVSFSFTGIMLHPEVPWESEAFGIQRPKDEQMARFAFSTGITAAVHEFSPYIALDESGFSIKPKGEEISQLNALTIGLPSFHACIARQLYNHVVERAPYKECANETCTQIFVHQVRKGRGSTKGRAQYAPHKDSIYCSRRCANTQWQRNKRAEQRLSEKGAK